MEIINEITVELSIQSYSVTLVLVLSFFVFFIIMDWSHTAAFDLSGWMDSNNFIITPQFSLSNLTLFFLNISWYLGQKDIQHTGLLL